MTWGGLRGPGTVYIRITDGPKEKHAIRAKEPSRYVAARATTRGAQGTSVDTAGVGLRGHAVQQGYAGGVVVRGHRQGDGLDDEARYVHGQASFPARRLFEVSLPS